MSVCCEGKSESSKSSFIHVPRCDIAMHQTVTAGAGTLSAGTGHGGRTLGLGFGLGLLRASQSHTIDFQFSSRAPNM